MTPPGGPPAVEGELLLSPSPERVAGAQMTRYLAWLSDERGREFEGYEDLWRWSVTDLEGFWSSIWDWSAMGGSPPAPLVERGAAGVEGSRFAARARGNYVDQVLGHDPSRTAVVALDETGLRDEVTYGELRSRAGAIAAGLRSLGVGPGDRVAAVLPNGVEAVVALLATASIGAVWTSCAPEFGAAAMVDRFSQVSPKVLLVADGYRYGGKAFPIDDKAAALEAALGPATTAVEVATLGDPEARARTPGSMRWSELGADAAALAPVALPGDHPLWVLYSSGTTGLPKAIVHSHLGIALEHNKVLRLHQDLGQGDRFCWYTTTGWMMWNYLVGGLLVGSTIVCFDGSPLHPDPMALWRIAAEQRLTCLGVSAPYLDHCRKLDLDPKGSNDLSSLRTIGSTGAPLSPESHAWASAAAGDGVLVGSISGGTDVCTAFLGSCPLLEVRAGELQCRSLGAAVAAYDGTGRATTGEVGELVVTEPMPSMPIALWGDEDGRRLHESYFGEFDGVWRHGDWLKLTDRGSAVVYGRSDATMNRGGIRTGTAELYRVVDRVDEVTDCLAVDTTELGREGELILLVVLEDHDPAVGSGGSRPPAAIEAAIASAIRRELSPRHVPDHFVVVAALPRTLNGKKIEVPIRRVLLGADPAAVVSRDALADPAAYDAVIAALKAAGLG